MTDDGTSRAARRDALTGFLLLLAAGSLAFGFFLPVIRVDRFLLFSSTSSLPEMMFDLVEDGEYLLAAILAVFTLTFPVFKIALLTTIWWRSGKGGGRAYRLLTHVGRWSMLDILVLALVIFSAKASGLASAASEPALYCFSAAVIFSMAATIRLERRQRMAGERQTARIPVDRGE